MEDKNYKELTDFIGGQFGRVYNEFDKVYNEFDRVHKRIDKIEFRLDDLKGDFVQLQSSVDAYAKKADTYFMEMAALGSRKS